MWLTCGQAHHVVGVAVLARAAEVAHRQGDALAAGVAAVERTRVVDAQVVAVLVGDDAQLNRPVHPRDGARHVGEAGPTARSTRPDHVLVLGVLAESTPAARDGHGREAVRVTALVRGRGRIPAEHVSGDRGLPERLLPVVGGHRVRRGEVLRADEIGRPGLTPVVLEVEDEDRQPLRSQGLPRFDLPMGGQDADAARGNVHHPALLPHACRARSRESRRDTSGLAPRRRASRGLSSSSACTSTRPGPCERRPHA